MPRKSTLPPDAPVWLTEDRRIDEMTFCCSFLEAHPMKCVHGKLYTVDGLISDEAALKREIFMEICDWVKSGTARKVEDLLKAVRMMAFADEPPLHQDRIHVSNGTWYADVIAFGSGVGINDVFQRGAVIDSFVSIQNKVKTQISKIVFLLSGNRFAGF